MNTGYSKQRDAIHDAALKEVTALLAQRGYKVQLLEVDGHRPDASLGHGEYFNVKTGEPNVVIEINSWNEYRRIETVERGRVYIIWRNRWKQWLVFTVSSLAPGIEGGPRRATGNGSNDDWYKINPRGRGIPLEAFFVPI